MRATALALVTVAVGVAAWGAGLRAGDAGRCGVPGATAAGGTGCCYYNRGVCDCEGGQARCCDGKMSASCRCAEQGPRTRDITVPTQVRLSLADFAFASQEVPEPPSLRLTQFRLADDALRFWFRLDCGDECWSRLAVNDTLPVEVRWLFDPGYRPVLDGVPQTIALPRRRPSVFVTRPVTQLRPGRWETEVRFGTDRLCLRGDTCWFPVEVRQ